MNKVVILTVLVPSCIVALYFIIKWWCNWEFPDEWDDDDRNNGKHGWWGE